MVAHKKLKIAIFTDSYLPAVDGVVTYITRTRKELERRGHRVYIFAAGNSRTKELCRKDKRLFVFKGVKFVKYNQYTISLNPYMTKMIKKIKPDLIHSQTPFSMGLMAIVSKNLYGTKMINTFHTLVNSDDMVKSYFNSNKAIKSISKKLVEMYFKWFYSKSDLVIAPSDYSRKVLEKIGLSNVIVIPNGIDPQPKVNKSRARKMLGISDDYKVLLYLGRLGYEKNLRTLVLAAGGFVDKNILLIIAGMGPALNELRELAAANNLSNVRFVGFVPENMKKYYYASADIFVNPSTIEVLSTVDIEALYTGIPILVPKNSSQENLILGGKRGETFDGSRPDDLCAKAALMLKNIKKYSPKKGIEEYSLKNSVNSLLSAYYSVLEKD